MGGYTIGKFFLDKNSQFNYLTKNFNNKSADTFYLGMRLSRIIKGHFHLMVENQNNFGLKDLNNDPELDIKIFFHTFQFGIGYRFVSCE